MNELDQKARLDMALSALQLLAGEESGWHTRKNMFVPPVSPGTVGKKMEAAYNKAIKTRKWQNDVLERWLKDGIVEHTKEGGQDLYHAAIPGEIRRIIVDHNEDGLKLSKFVFPHLVSLPGEYTDKLEKAEESDDSDKDTEDTEQDMGEETVSVLTAAVYKQNGILAELLDIVRNGHIEVAQSINAHSDALMKSDKEFARLLGSMEKEIHGVKKRVSELETTVVAVREQLASGQAALNATKTALKDASSMGENYSQMTNAFRGIVHQFAALTQANNALVGAYRRANDDKLGKVLKRMEEHLTEGETLRSLLLDTVAERSEDERQGSAAGGSDSTVQGNGTVANSS